MNGLNGYVISSYKQHVALQLDIWVWVNTYRYIFSGMNIHLPAILGFTRYQGFDPSPYDDIFLLLQFQLSPPSPSGADADSAGSAAGS